MPGTAKGTFLVRKCNEPNAFPWTLTGYRTCQLQHRRDAGAIIVSPRRVFMRVVVCADDENISRCVCPGLLGNDVGEGFTLGFKSLSCRNVSRFAQSTFDVLGCSGERGTVIDISRTDLGREAMDVQCEPISSRGRCG